MLVYRAGWTLTDPRTGQTIPKGELVARDFPGFETLLQNGGVFADRSVDAPITKAPSKTRDVAAPVDADDKDDA